MYNDVFFYAPYIPELGGIRLLHAVPPRVFLIHR